VKFQIRSTKSEMNSNRRSVTSSHGPPRSVAYSSFVSSDEPGRNRNRARCDAIYCRTAVHANTTISPEANSTVCQRKSFRHGTAVCWRVLALRRRIAAWLPKGLPKKQNWGSYSVGDYPLVFCLGHRVGAQQERFGEGDLVTWCCVSSCPSELPRAMNRRQELVV
jgi:hypothetical protein